MSEAPATPSPMPRRQGSTWIRRTIVASVAVLLAIAIAVISYTSLPRWWAQRAAEQVDGSLSTGLVLGFMYGFLCTLLPIVVLAVVYRFFRRRSLAWVIGGTLAILLASPNLVTLWIAVGTGDAAHAADRTLDVDAPWFRGGMLSGAVAATLSVVYLVVARRRARSGQAAERDEQIGAAEPTPPP